MAPSDSAERFLRRFLDTYERCELVTLWSFYGDDCRFPVLERFGIEPSWENYRRFMTTFIEAFPDVHHHIEKVVADGENVWALYTITGTHRGRLRGMQPTGRSVRYSIVAMYRIADGLIVETDLLSEELRMMRQLGQLPD
jgi:predicted ester cyclase